MHLTLASHTTGRDSISIVYDAFGCYVPTPKNMRKARSCSCSFASRLLLQPQISTPYNSVESTRALVSFLKIPIPTSPAFALHLFSQALSALLPAAAFYSTISFSSRCSSTTQPRYLYILGMMPVPASLLVSVTKCDSSAH